MQNNPLCPACNLFMLKRHTGTLEQDRLVKKMYEFWCGKCGRTSPAPTEVKSPFDTELEEWIKLNELPDAVAELVRKKHNDLYLG